METTSDDKLWSALSYVFAPLVGIIALLMEDKKARPYVKFNAVQSIVASIALWVIASILSTVTLGIGAICLVPLVIVLMLYWAYQAYQGQDVRIPMVSDFVRKQGWG